MSPEAASLRPEDYDVTDEDIEAGVCPLCFADSGEPCVTPSDAEALDHHRPRVRKAQSIARDVTVAGCLPEHDPVEYDRAMRAAKRAARAARDPRSSRTSVG